MLLGHSVHVHYSISLLYNVYTIHVMELMFERLFCTVRVPSWLARFQRRQVLRCSSLRPRAPRRSRCTAVVPRHLSILALRTSTLWYLQLIGVYVLCQICFYTYCTVRLHLTYMCLWIMLYERVFIEHVSCCKQCTHLCHKHAYCLLSVRISYTLRQ
jgi:hypothetical protein